MRHPRTKPNRCYIVVTVCVILCGIFYLPALFSAHYRIHVYEWGMTRDLRVYVRPENATSLLSNDRLCGHGDVTLIVVVCSAVANVEARAVIRDTWGSVVQNQTQVKLAFILGRPENGSVQEDVFRESETYQDIIQEDFLDTYNNLTLKSVMLLKWVSTRCRNARYVMKTDDDMFVNIPVLVSHLRRYGRPKLLLGCLICGAVPVKDKSSKWYTPSFMYSGRIYPNYLSGTGYVLSRDIVGELYSLALATPFFHLEDIYITGICAKKLKLKPQHYEGFSYQSRTLNPCLYRKIITSHRIKSDDLVKIWSQMNSPNLKCDKKLKFRDYTPGRCL